MSEVIYDQNIFLKCGEDCDAEAYDVLQAVGKKEECSLKMHMPIL